MKLCKDCKWFRRNLLNQLCGWEVPKCVRPGLSADRVYGKLGYHPCEVERDKIPPYGCGEGAQYWEAK